MTVIGVVDVGWDSTVVAPGTADLSMGLPDRMETRPGNGIRATRCFGYETGKAMPGCAVIDGIDGLLWAQPYH